MAAGDPDARHEHDTNPVDGRGAADSDPGDVEADEELQPGAKLGRYVLFEKIGSGGMGVVYAAFDPQLDRKIALKLMRTGSRGGGSDGRTRLLREAQAMARLSHPNVITVHDVGIIDDRVFVAMEFVEGQTLRAWLRRPRKWRDVLELCVRAGRGLAAAHAAGLVHRDFKPDNVLIGDDARVRVLDFGLAAPAGRANIEVTQHGDAPTVLDEKITRTGARMGTPAYMAPEQHLGKATDARSDQFSFCVTLYQALYGERPFDGENAPELKQEIVDGRIRSPPSDSHVPSWVRRVLLRGLESQPDVRYPSMPALLAELERDPAARRRRWLLGIAGVGVTAMAVYGYVGSITPVSHLCRGADRKLEGKWDAPTRNAGHNAFVATAKPYADAAWRGVEATLDEYTREWVAMHTDACEATRLRAEQSEDLLDRRMACLNRRLEELGMLTKVFARADATVVERAVQAARALGPVAACGDVQTLESAMPMPDDVAKRADAAVVRSEISAAHTMLVAGKYEDGLELAQATATRARALGYRPVEAEALVVYGELQRESGELWAANRMLEDAIVAAEAGGHTAAAIEAWTQRIAVASYLPELHLLAAEWERHAAALIEWRGAEDELDARLLSVIGDDRMIRGRYGEAVDNHRRALDILERVRGADDLEVAEVLTGLGNACTGLGDFNEALKHLERAQELSEHHLGPDHPAVAGALNGMAITYDELGRSSDSRRLYQRALEIWEAALHPDHPKVATALNNLGGVYYGEGDYPRALSLFEQALDIWSRAYSSDNPDVALTLGNLGLVLDALGRSDEAIEHHRRALALYERAYGPDHPDVATSLVNLGDMYAYMGNGAEALTLLERALAIREAALGLEHPHVALVLQSMALASEGRDDFEAALQAAARSRDIVAGALGEQHGSMIDSLTRVGAAELGRGRPSEALEPLERAVELHETHGSALDTAAESRFLLARALWDTGGDRTRARSLAEQARDGYEKASDETALPEADAWLSTHRRAD